MKKIFALIILGTLLSCGAYAFTLTITFYELYTMLPISGVFVYRDPPTPLPNQWGPSDAMGRVTVPDYSAGTYYWYLDDDYLYVEWLQPSVTFTDVYSNVQLVIYGVLVSVDGPPDPPSDLIAQALPGNQIALTWSDNSENESGFIIERRLDNTDWEFLVDLYIDTQSYLDSGLTPGTTYYYRVYAYGFDDSDYSNIAHATSSLLPGPALLDITQIGTDQIRLEWNAAANCTFYKIYLASEPLAPGSPGWTYIGQTSELFYNASSVPQKQFYLVRGVAP